MKRKLHRGSMKVWSVTLLQYSPLAISSDGAVIVISSMLIHDGTFTDYDCFQTVLITGLQDRRSVVDRSIVSYIIMSCMDTSMSGSA